MDIQSIVRNCINTEIRELKNTIEVEEWKLKHDGYHDDPEENRKVIHTCKSSIQTLEHLQEELSRRIGFSIYDVFGNFYTARLDRDDLVKELKRIITEDQDSKAKSPDQDVRELPPQTFEIRFKEETIATIVTVEEADKVNLDRYLKSYDMV